MTQIGQHVRPTKRPGELGVHSLDHFSLVVPDLKPAQKFYTDFGLTLREKDGRLGMYTGDNPHCWGTISEGDRKHVGHRSFGVFEEDFEPMKKRLQDMGIKRLDAPKGWESNGLWFNDHDGNLLEVRVAEKSSPTEKSVATISSVKGGQRGQVGRAAAEKISPRRFAHMLMFTSNAGEAMRFYTRVLGMRVSDHSGEGIAFMHGIHGSDHHMMAWAGTGAPGMHHLSWDVGSVQDIGLGTKQMMEAGHDKGWGLGRHVLGSNYFYYVRDPWGSYSEYSCDIDYVPHDCDWDTGDHPPEDSIYVWGPKIPEDFIHNYEAER